MTSSEIERTGTDFVRELVQRDIDEGTFGGRVQTRFPPEPNGYLHIGHAKAITLDYELAREFGGTCNLRFDDTNPDTEDTSYVDGIIGECGGSMSCATCHVVVDPGWSDRAGGASPFEEDMLDITEAGRQPTSRLSCQIRMSAALDGIVVSVPQG